MGRKAIEKAVIDNRYTYHPPKNDQSDRYEQIRTAAKAFALTINELCPPSPERANAKDRIDEAMMWANASIARHE
jgi:hypothetical protein